jgi:hypothetical protein
MVRQVEVEDAVWDGKAVKHSHAACPVRLAGAGGFEPPVAEPKSAALPLGYAPFGNA